ncbi:MAG TPA: hypothetical protein VD907_06950 [Verrucomicrobiae bacterium]|nr:hypothetical protein [Verrucomicrobiae bacterium]
MASFFTRALDRFTPWDRKGEVQRRQQRKKKEEEEIRAATPSIAPSRPQSGSALDRVIKPKAPVNIFDDINKGFVLGKPSTPAVVTKTQETKPAPVLPPGTVVKPPGLQVGPVRQADIQLPDGRNARDLPAAPKKTEMAKPKQGLGNRFRDMFDANTESDKWRRQEGNKNLKEGEKKKEIVLKNPGNLISRTPVVGTTTKMLNTAATQIASLPSTVGGQFATSEYSAATEEYTKAVKSGDKGRIAKAKQRVGNAVDRLDDYNAQQDAAHSMFEKNKGGLFNAGTLYDEKGSKSGDIKTGVKDVVLPTAVTALDLYTLGRGSAVSQGIKEQGLRTGARSQAGNIGKAAVGNYGSGDLNARSEGASNTEAVKAGIINSILGLAPDIALPALGRSFRDRVVPRIFRGRGVSASDVVEELDDAAISASAEAANQALRPKPVQVTKDIPVRTPDDPPVPVPVVRGPSRRPLIKELEGDFNFPTFEKLNQIRVEKARTDADEFNAGARPDFRLEGVTPRATGPFRLDENVVIGSQDEAIDAYAGFLRQVGEGNGVDIVDGRRVSNNVRFGDTAGQRMTQAMWRDEAERQLKAGKADPAIQKMFDDAADPEVQSLIARGDTTEEAPVGRPIEVKEATSIPVRDETVVPTDMPEAPGAVRVTAQAAPMKDRTEAIAAAPVVSSPPRLPAETQAILDNPQQFNKRQVAAARNQAKLARQKAKADEGVADALTRIEAAKSPSSPQPEGYASTGQFDRGKKGNVYEVASRETEAVAGQQEMAARSVDDLLAEVGSKESFTPGDRRRISAALENLVKANPEDTETRMILKKLQSQSRTELAQGLAMWPRVVRKSSTADTLTGRWESKIARALDDPSKMKDADFAEIQAKNEAFTLARDTAERLNEQFKRTGSEADFKAWEDAFTAARKADEDAKFAEIAVAKRVLKGEKGAHVNKVLDDLRKESSVNTMDLVTSNMLSGTATGFRNTFGTELAGIENRVGANFRAKVVKGLFDENVGGFSRQGARLGRKIGIVKLGRDARRRAEIGGKNPLEMAKNWATTINSGGESSIQSQVYSRLGKYYQNQLKEQGVSGKELDMRMRHSMLTDPDGMADTYLDASMKSSGLTGLFDKGQTIEKAVTDYVGRQTDNKMLQGASKLIMRLAVGFPTATTNFLYQSGKRLAVGVPSYIEMGAKLAKGDKLGAAQAFERGMKETGSGLAVLGLGVALGQAGMITGAYPEDPDERARWEREGISENSINIGGAWFPIPQGAGMLGLPLLTGAAIGRDGGDGLKEMYDPGNLAKLLPTDQIQGFLNMASGDGAPQDFKNFVASGVRAVTPAGALFNQIAKSFDDTKNDTTTKDLWSNIIDQIASGIPGVNNAMNIPDKTDDAGNVIKNPNPVQLAFGATSATQGAGQERSAQIDKELNDALRGIDQYGLLDDPNMEGVLEEKGLEAYNKLKSGKTLDESDIKALKNGLVKGVSSEGTDTAYLERGEYDTNLAVLKLKRDLMKEDKTTKPSSLKDVDTAIKRGEIYRDGQVPYDMIQAYQTTGVDEWRKMGDPESDEYDPDMYQRLWELDERMSKAGVSYKRGALDKPKYSAKQAGSGRGSRGGAGSYSADFGQLKAGAFAPSVQEYETIDQKSGNVPIIRKVRPNIVHNISSSG